MGKKITYPLNYPFARLDQNPLGPCKPKKDHCLSLAVHMTLPLPLLQNHCLKLRTLMLNTQILLNQIETPSSMRWDVQAPRMCDLMRNCPQHGFIWRAYRELSRLWYLALIVVLLLFKKLVKFYLLIADAFLAWDLKVWDDLLWDRLRSLSAQNYHPICQSLAKLHVDQSTVRIETLTQTSFFQAVIQAM